jgi:hypothetical protein
MNSNLNPEIEYKLDQVGDFIEENLHEYTKEDSGYFSRNNSASGPFSIGLSPEIMYYDNKAVIWCRVSLAFKNKGSGDREFWAVDFEECDKIRESLPWKAFFDEDAQKRRYTHVKNHAGGFDYTSFFVNPEEPEGYWQNHAIPYK